jgi:eukaryotic-like serine/threonine-protein kinase
VTPVTQLNSALREKFEHHETDFAITRRNSRQRSKIVDSRIGILLEAFRVPKTLADGLNDFGRTVNVPPADLVDSVGEILLKLIQARILTVQDSQESQRTVAKLRLGEQVGHFCINQEIQIIDDSEVYRGTVSSAAAALKIARYPAANSSIEREAKILRQIPSNIGPRLLGEGRLDGRAWITMEWLDGSPPTKIARLLRSEGTSASGHRLLRLCLDILEAYSALHSSGFLHGDLHPKNIIVGSDGPIRLIDFGLAFRLSETSPGRGGVEAYYEPELARQLLDGKKPSPGTALGEQYALSVLLYELLTGSSYLYFSVEKGKMLRQIVEELPVPFAMRGLFGHSLVQNVLEKALSKDPAARFSSVQELTDAFRQAYETIRSRRHESFPSTNDSHVRRFLEEACDLDGGLISDVFRNAPSCSVNHGGAGVAYSLYRLATQLNDSRILSSADVWIQRALATLDDEKAFYNASLDLLPRTIGTNSLYHGAPGVHCVHALISGAAGDFISQQEAIAGFLRTSSSTSNNLDLTIGKSGLLLGTVLLLDATHRNSLVESSALKNFGSQLFDQIWFDAKIAQLPDMLGMAHGTAGMVYAALRWCQRMSLPLPDSVKGYLGYLLDAAEFTSIGIRWRRLKSGNDYVPSWCNGAGGFVFLWTEAYRVTGLDRYLELAEGAAQTALNDKERRASLCCGLAGRAYSLLNLFKHTGDGKWMDAAATMLSGAHEASGYSLYNGAPGSVLLAVDLSHPEGSCMPVFESDQAL